MPKNSARSISPHNKSLARQLPPAILTIFGATGDLSSDYLLPALLHMDEEGMLPKDFQLVCVGRRDFTAKSYFDFIVKKSSVLKRIPLKTRQHFLKRLTYYRGNFEDPASFVPLAKILSDREKPKHVCYNRLYYFATSPQFFASITHILKESGLLTSCTSHERKVRILVEKPFGFNLGSARDLNKLLLKYFTEDQIYRIDHYMGKETVQNLMVVRFANRLFEPLWNKDYIDHIEISVLEKDTARARAEFYDQTGALKDFVQNHILQMLALVTMDEPKELQTELIRDEKLKILRALRPFATSPNLPFERGGMTALAGSDQERGVLPLAERELEEVSKPAIIRGQYIGYAKDVGHPSDTESYVALKAFIDSPRWQNVPVYIRTGKALSKKETEISIHFKELDRCLFRGCAANVLTFRIQPDESVYLQINNKIPGFGIDLHQGLLEFGYKEAFTGEIPSAYERLLLDFLEGDQRLFIRSDEIEAAWAFIDSISENWKGLPIYKYKPGSNGPAEADAFIQNDNREWWTK